MSLQFHLCFSVFILLIFFLFYNGGEKQKDEWDLCVNGMGWGGGGGGVKVTSDKQ